MWTNLSFLSLHRACITISQVDALLWARPGGGIPSISTGCAQARDRCAQDIHMVVHTKPVAAQWPPRSVAGRSGRAGTARATARHPVLRGVHRWPGVGSRARPLPRSRSVDQTIPRSATVFGQTGRILQARGHDRGTSHCEHPRAIGEQANGTGQRSASPNPTTPPHASPDPTTPPSASSDPATPPHR